MVRNNLTNLLDVATKAAKISGSLLLKRHASSFRIDFESQRDLKIAADKQSEKQVIKFLQKNSDFSILSEEKRIVKGKNKKYTWIVDPLDGTLNYVRGLPVCCVSVGLWKNTKPVLGVIYDFNRREIFSGIAGCIAWLNGLRIKVSDIRKKDKAVLCTGLPVNTEFSVKRISSFVNDIRSYKRVRLLGSAALSLAYVASGRADIYYEKNIMLWDVAGGIPIVLGAGGKVNTFQETKKQYSYNVRVTNGIGE